MKLDNSGSSGGSPVPSTGITPAVSPLWSSVVRGLVLVLSIDQCRMQDV